MDKLKNKGNTVDIEQSDSISDSKDDSGVEDYNTLDVGEDGGEEPIYPYTTIKIEKDQYSIFEMLRKYHNDRVKLDPAFQRNFVWDNKQMSELIESVIMGIPLPLIYLAENRDGKMVVVDGRQRLTTFFKFLDNRFKLDQLKILRELNGKLFKDLESVFPKYAAAVEDYQLMIQVIKYPTPDRIMFDIFDRVNRGGKPLNKQEMRNALYQGHSTELLEKITHMNGFQKATGEGISDKRMKDRYIVLRAIAFSMLYENELFDSKGKIVEYKSDIDDLMGKTMDALNRKTKEEIDRISECFDRIMFRIYDVLGEDAFRLKGKHGVKRPISMTLFETLYYLFFLLDGEKYDDAGLNEKISKLLEDNDYLDALQKSVDSAKVSIVRFDKVKKIYEEIING